MKNMSDSNINKEIDVKLFGSTGKGFIPRYSLSIELAWEVVDIMGQLGWLLNVGEQCEYQDKPEKLWRIIFCKKGDNHVGFYKDKSAPLAICKAALDALNDMALDNEKTNEM